MRRIFNKRRQVSRFYSLSIPVLIAAVAGIGLVSTLVAPLVLAVDESKQAARVITVHDQGVGKGILTNAETLRAAFKEHGISINERDHVEPGLDEELEADVYDVNIYRARPVTVIDGTSHYRIETPYQTPRQIVEDIGMTLYDEDEATLRASTDPLLDGSGVVLEISRATKVNLDFFGKKTIVRTMATTVADLLAEKDITLASNETASKPLDTAITEGMKLALWRNGEQTTTRSEAINFPVQVVEDADKPAGYRKVTAAGVKGEKKVTYKISMRNGKELRRKAIHTVVVKKPKKQVEVIGAKFNYTGGKLSEKQINALGQCESGMTANRNSGNGFYGAFQFMPSTWRNVAPEPYRGVLPHQAPLGAQKQAVQNLVSGSNIYNQFPACAAMMRDQGIL